MPSSIGLRQLPPRRAWVAAPARLPGTIGTAKTKRQNTLNPQHPLHKGHAGCSLSVASIAPSWEPGREICP